MSRRTLDLIFASGGAAVAVLLIVLGFVLVSEADFARSYVKDQLGDQKITFAAADKLTDEAKSWKPGSICLTDYASQLMETGKQAECYANYYIALHVASAATAAGFPGETYATLGALQTTLKAQIADATAKGDKAAAEAAQAKLTAATTARSTAQTGETLRGLLLTSYGFSIFGEKAGLAGNFCYAIGGLLALLSIAGFVHALRTRPDELVGVPDGYKLVPPA
jgi:hypothetical protein